MLLKVSEMDNVFQTQIFLSQNRCQVSCVHNRIEEFKDLGNFNEGRYR